MIEGRSNEHMKRLLALGLVFGLVVAGCSSAAAPSPSPSATAAPTPTPVAFNIGMVTDNGQLEEKSFKQLSW
jgi:ABC-type glycerol-3-phosphate transport system substrate-binding protein